MVPSNFHTHTHFCDGKDTPEDIVREAIRLGCPAVGFSGHGFTLYDRTYCMSLEATEAYCAEISRLKKIYRDKIKIYLGLEKDYYSQEDTSRYDYIIGSVHYVNKNGIYLAIDNNEEEFLWVVGNYYGGDFYALAEAYYENVGNVYEKTHCNIIGHFDLVTKYNEKNKYFDVYHPRYVAAARKALNKLLPSPAYFEINSGAISRGCRTTPYPDDRWLSLIKEAGHPILYTSDSHAKETLLFGLPEDAPLPDFAR
ncbi:MAG: histidinol-phosphatase HisJ family protein [Clostridia bacterium]|nr:histidinol-phosphatase HisJ family protein [Clostridia bacterium]